MNLRPLLSSVLLVAAWGSHAAALQCAQTEDFEILLDRVS